MKVRVTRKVKRSHNVDQGIPDLSTDERAGIPDSTALYDPGKGECGCNVKVGCALVMMSEANLISIVACQRCVCVCFLTPACHERCLANKDNFHWLPQ